MSDVFISYAREDAAWAEALASRFEGRGWTVFWDRSLLAGDQFRRIIREELAAAQAVVVLWSHDSVESGWVLDEARVGKDRNVLVPAVVDDAPIPLGFGQIQSSRLEWASGRSAPLGVDRVEASLERLIGGATSTSSSSTAPKTPAPQPTRTTQKQLFLAAAAMSAFIAAGFWLTPARPGYMFFRGSSADIWTWVGLFIMMPALFAGAYLSLNAEPWRTAAKAVGASAVVGGVLVLGLLVTGAGESQSIGFLVAVWVGTTLAIPPPTRRQWIGRIAVLLGAVVGTLWLHWWVLARMDVEDIDYAAWFAAVLIPLALVASDWAIARPSPGRGR